jgi:hypothetical protein
VGVEGAGNLLACRIRVVIEKMLGPQHDPRNAETTLKRAGADKGIGEQGAFLGGKAL